MGNSSWFIAGRAMVNEIVSSSGSLIQTHKKRDLSNYRSRFGNVYPLIAASLLYQATYLWLFDVLPLCWLLLLPMLRFSLLRSLPDLDGLVAIFLSFSRLLLPLCFVVGIT